MSGERVRRATIFDYGAGNLHSLAKVLAGAGVEVRIEADPLVAIETDVLVLPGVGAFTGAAERLGVARTTMREAILNGLPTLGICLGMQLLFSSSEEGEGEGLGVIPGTVRRIRARRVPQMGWNEVVPVTGKESHIWDRVQMMYFANSYVCEPEDTRVVVGYTTHESDRFVSVVQAGRAIGVQFHPEKSSAAGVAFVHNFVRGVTR